ncbi:MAG TPA: DUF4397 domain-containing protein [Puia sp.]|jgi:hypothetical protein|nr:DUF4397 domain-containing protein [Puia sp.]
MKPRTFNSGKAIFVLLFFFSLIIFIASCTKSSSSPTPTSGSAFVSVTNASPTLTAYAVYSDATNIYTAGTLGYGSTTGVVGGNPYATVAAGIHSIKLVSGGNNIVIDSNATFTAGGHYSFFVYDTGQVKTLALTDNLTAPASGMAKIRFLNFAPNSQSLNVWVVNTDTTTKDSTSFSNIGYIGSTVINVDSLSAFKTIPAGTHMVLFNSNAELNLFQNKSVTFASGKIYTLYAKGYVNGLNATDSLGLGVIQNY